MLKNISQSKRPDGVVVPVTIPWNHNHLPSFFCSNSSKKLSCVNFIYPECSNFVPDIDNNGDSVRGKAPFEFIRRCNPNWESAVAATGLGALISQPFSRMLRSRTSFLQLSTKSSSDALSNLNFVGMSRENSL